ncbi:MAG: FtsW/RodA/SpoVE family cell cycle protein, partial [Pseudomonadota bacterium]|nr:FtsW/RodA/SpoVE family cell cycle protein [Pseudomonadota bacterium]
IPTKGMTLPLISYGGSSLVASGLTMGLILALTRRRAPYVIPGRRNLQEASS